MAGLVPAIPMEWRSNARLSEDARDTGERSDAVLRTAMRGHDNLESHHSGRRQSVDIGHNIDHSGPFRSERLGERRRKRRRLFDANAERAHILRNAREIDLAEGP